MSVDVEVLVHTHKRAHRGEDGIEFHSVPSLISQLRDAIHGGGVQDGAGAGGKSKLPFQAAALDLYNLIERQVWEVHRQGLNRVLGAVTPEVVVGEWAAWATPETVVEVGGRRVYASQVVEQWVAAIEDYFNPPRLAPIDLPCPSCGERYVTRDMDGEHIQSAALAFNRDRGTGDTTDARCAACGAVWMPGQFMYFLRALQAGTNHANGSGE